MAKHIHCRIAPELLERFEAALKREGLSRTHVVIQGIHDFVNQSENR